MTARLSLCDLEAEDLNLASSHRIDDDLSVSILTPKPNLANS